MKQLIRQTFALLRQNPLLSIVSILGTAFAITMIMAIVMNRYSRIFHRADRSDCHLASRVEHRALSPRFVWSLVTDGADGDGGYLVSGTQGDADTTGRGATRRVATIWLSI